MKVNKTMGRKLEPDLRPLDIDGPRVSAAEDGSRRHTDIEAHLEASQGRDPMGR